MTALDLAVIAFATLYAAYALTKTHGPFGVFTLIRQRLPLGGVTACIVCAAFWCAAIFYVLYQTDLRPVPCVFAAAGLAVFAGAYTGLNQQ